MLTDMICFTMLSLTEVKRARKSLIFLYKQESFHSFIVVHCCHLYFMSMASLAIFCFRLYSFSLLMCFNKAESGVGFHCFVLQHIVACFIMFYDISLLCNGLLYIIICFVIVMAYHYLHCFVLWLVFVCFVMFYEMSFFALLLLLPIFISQII